MDERLLPTRAEIDLGAIAHNIQEIKKQIPASSRIMAVVKADAYGHGAVAVSETALANGVAYLGVASLKEAAQLRSNGITAPIILLSETLPDFAPDVLALNLTQSVYSLRLAEALSEAAQKLGKNARVHIKIDTGMGRIGVYPEAALPLIEAISHLKNIEIEGIFTHLAKGDDLQDNFTDEQLDKFKEVLQALDKKGIKIPIKHVANSAGTLFRNNAFFNMVRIGIAMYGLFPNLVPALAFKSKVMYLKKVPAGTPLSYGGTYVTPRATQIATLPVGYADGFSRAFSNRGHVLIRGKRFPVVGSVCMDFTLVDVGDEKVAVGDDAVLIGRQGNEEISVDELAKMLGNQWSEIFL
jgi:alanine racemase